MQKQTLVTALTTWIDQQQKTGLNLASSITEFNQLKDNYNDLSAGVSGSEEMKHLIKLLANVSETRWSEVKEDIQKSLLERITAIKIPLASDEKTLHFFLSETDSTYRHQDINNWMTAYPDYNMKIWTDDSFHLSTQIFNRLQTKIGVDLEQSLANYAYDVANTLEIMMLNRRRYAHTQISEAMQAKISLFRQTALSDYIRANPNVLTTNDRNRIEHASLPDFLNHLGLSQGKVDELRASVLSEYIKKTFNLDDNEINRINTAYNTRAQDLVSALQVRHRDGNVTIEHKKVIINDELNSPYLNRLILTANRQQAIHTIGLAILKEQGGVFINIGGKVNSAFDHVNHLKIDPLLGAAYSKNLNVIIAKKNSPFINALFTREEKIKTILAAFPDIEKGIMPSQITLGAIKARLNSENLAISVDELASYAYETLRNPSYTDVTDFFAGERGYFDVFKQQIQLEIGTSLKEKSFLPLIIPCIKDMTIDTVATAADPGPSMITSKDRFAFKPNVTGHTRYTRQIVIQLTEDQAVSASAMALHRKNKAISSLYRYHETDNTLIMVEAGTVTRQAGEVLRIILIAHGSDLSDFSAENIRKLFLDSNLLVRNQVVAKLSIVACRFAEGATSETTEAQILGHGPARRLFETLLLNAIQLEKMSVRDGYISIDNNGQKWISIQGDHTAAKREDRGYLSRLASTTEARIEIYQENGFIRYQRRPSEDSIEARSKVYANSFKRFGLFSPVEIDTAQEDDVFISKKEAKKLKGTINTEIAIKLLNNRSGNTVINASPMTLLAAMAESPHRVMVIDKDPYQIDALQKALIESRYHDTFSTWIEKIPLEKEAKQKLKALWDTFSLDDQQKYFAMVKRRVAQIAYDFFYGDISHSSMADQLILHKGQGDISIVHLNIDAVLLDNVAKLDREAAQKQVKNRLATLTQSFRVLCGSASTTTSTIYLYSLSDGLYKTFSQTDIDSLANHYIGLARDNYDYVTKIQLLNRQGTILPTIFNWVRQSLNILAADQAIKKLADNKRKIPGSSTAVNLSDSWIPLISEIEYDSSTKKFNVPYVDLDNPSKKEILTTDSKNFALAKQALDRQNTRLNQYFELDDNQPQLKIPARLSKIDAISMGSSSLFATLAIWGWVKNGITVQGNDGLAQALQMHTYVSMSEVAHSVTTDAITLGNFAQSKVQLALKSSLSKGPVGSFARGLRSFGSKIVWLGPLFDVTDIALSSTEYHLAKNETQATIFRAEIIFGSISLGLSLGFIVASVLGATLLSAVLLPVALLFAGLRYLVVSALEAAANDQEKAKIISHYFQQMQQGWANGGFKLEKGVLSPYQGVVIKTLDLRNPTNASVIFNPEGLKIKKSLYPRDTQLINCYELRDQQRVRTNIMLSNEAGTIRTLILPMTTSATLTPTYYVANKNDIDTTADFAALRYFHNQVKTNSTEDKAFIVTDPWLDTRPGGAIGTTKTNTRVPIELSFAYQATTVEILLGEHHYAFIAPGISEGATLADSAYKTLIYHLKGSQTGQAKVVLVLNRGQGAIKIDCTNQKVEWIIEARHLPFIELQDAKEGTNGRKLTFSSKKLLANGSYENETIATITVNDRVKTTLRIQLKRGAITSATSQDSYHYPARYALPTPSNGNSHTLEEANQFISAQTNYPQITHYLKIDKFKIHGVNCENCFYLKDQDKVVYIQNTRDLTFSQVRLMFYNDKYVFYQGDITFAMLNGIANQTLKQVFWISALDTNVAHQIYLPLLHLFEPQQEDPVDRKQADSVIIQTQILEKGILFKQQFTDLEGHSLFLTYLIETQNNANKLYLLEIQGLPVSDRASLTDDILNKIKTGMIKSVTLQIREHMQRIIPTWSDITLPTVSSLETQNRIGIPQLALPQNTSRIIIGDRLIWPMPDSLKGVTGTITAKIAAATLADAKYHIHLVGMVPGNKIEDHYYFWEVTEADNYNQFHALYLQRADREAEAVNLSNMNLTKNQIKNVTGADRGVYLHTHEGVRYYLSSNILKGGVFNSDGTRTLPTQHPSINNSYLFCKEDKIYLGRANNQQGIWMLSSPVTGEKVVHYLPGENITRAMFDCDVIRGIDTLLSTQVALPSIILPVISSDNSQTDQPAHPEKIIEASVAANGSLQVITSGGLILAIQVKNNSPTPVSFQLDLLGVTRTFSDQYKQNQTRLNQVFSLLSIQITLPEIIALPFDNQTDWYHPKSQTLFIPKSHAPYLGSNTASKTAYFSTINGDRAQLMVMIGTAQISATASYTGTSNVALSGHYSRQGDMLILNADHIDQPHDYFSLDGVSHFLLQIRQTKTQSFTFELKRLPYPVIGLFHDADRQVICQIDATITPQQVLMKRQNTELCLSIGTQWLVINDAFTDGKTHLDKLQLSFQGNTTDLQQLVNRYKNAVTAGNETELQIAIADPVLRQ